MALATYALTLADSLRDDLCVSTSELPESKAERFIDRASREFMRLAGNRDFHRGVALVHDVEGYGTPDIVAPRAPISSVTSVALLSAGDGTVSETYDATTYRVSDAGAGLVSRASGWPWTTQRGSGIRGGGVPGYEAKLLRITYDAGWITPYQASSGYPGGSLGTRDLPEDIETAVLIAAGSLFQSSGRDRAVVREQLGRASVTYQDSAASGTAASWMPAEAVAVAMSYRRDLP